MKPAHLAGVDLNLLVVLHELLQARSTTIAARRVGRTQSAVSHALARLRALFGDPLFVRVGPVLRPTAFAERLAPAVAEVLARAEAVLAGQAAAFDPSSLSRTFVVGATDYAELLILPGLLARLADEAPQVDLVMTFLGDDIERAIQAREVDLVIGTRFRAVSSLMLLPVAEQDMRLVVRRGHPATRGELTAERYAAFDHALVTPRGGYVGVVDTALEALGLRRRVALRLPHFVVAALVIARSELVITLPRSFAELMAREAPLTLLPVPLPIPPFHFAVAFSAAAASDPAHAWFRGVFADVARAALGAPGPPKRSRDAGAAPPREKARRRART